MEHGARSRAEMGAMSVDPQTVCRSGGGSPRDCEGGGMTVWSRCVCNQLLSRYIPPRTGDHSILAFPEGVVHTDGMDCSNKAQGKRGGMHTMVTGGEQRGWWGDGETGEQSGPFTGSHSAMFCISSGLGQNMCNLTEACNWGWVTRTRWKIMFSVTVEHWRIESWRH